jgi:uncharacterized protein (TIGR02453 family)
MKNEPIFKPALFRFLRELAQNNHREWFAENKKRYEELIKEPARQFIIAFGPRLQKISPHFRADPRPVGGSLFRIYRDTRFSKDKTPYKTHVGLHFRHAAGKNVHAPGFYLHIEPRQVFTGVGIWHPDAQTLKKIRHTLASAPDRWRKLNRHKRFKAHYELAGESLKRPPRGFSKNHPLIEDLKRKDIVAIARLTQGDVTADDFLERFDATCRAGAPLVAYLCDAIGVPF